MSLMFDLSVVETEGNGSRMTNARALTSLYEILHKDTYSSSSISADLVKAVNKPVDKQHATGQTE